jgi:hypothetical protein
MLQCISAEDVLRQRAERKISTILSQRHGILIGELCQRLNQDPEMIKSILRDMVIRGEVERLRPVGYDGDDHDFFARIKDEGHVWDY